MSAYFHGTDPRDNFEFHAVCDGLGGLREGAQCASLALSYVLAGLVESRRSPHNAHRLRFVLDSANKEIYSRYHEQGGTTIAGVLLAHGVATGMAVGDTRLYSVDASGELRQVSVDDTIGARIAQLDPTDSEVASQSPFANHLAQFIGQSGAVSAQILEFGASLSGSTASAISQQPRGLIIASDGAYRLPKSVFEDVMRNATNHFEAANRLLRVSDWLGGHDNATLLLLDKNVRPAKQDSWATPVLILRDPYGEMCVEISVSPMPGIADVEVARNPYKYKKPAAVAPRIRAGLSYKSSVSKPVVRPQGYESKPRPSIGAAGSRSASGRGLALSETIPGLEERLPLKYSSVVKPRVATGESAPVVGESAAKKSKAKRDGKLARRRGKARRKSREDEGKGQSELDISFSRESD